MGVEFTDVMQLPKHRGKSVLHTLKSDPGYLLWLRDKEAEKGRIGYFDPTVLVALNEAIRKDPKNLGRQRAEWNELSDGRVVPFGAGASTHTTPAAADDDEDRRPSLAEVTQAQTAQQAYADLWGCF